MLGDEDEYLGDGRSPEQPLVVDLHDEVELYVLRALQGLGQRHHGLVVGGPAQAEGGAGGRGHAGAQGPRRPQLQLEDDGGALEAGPAHGEEVELSGEGQLQARHEGDVVEGEGERLAQAVGGARGALAQPGGQLAAAATIRGCWVRGRSLCCVWGFVALLLGSFTH